MDTENTNPTPEELEAERAATQQLTEEEVRTKVIGEYDFDPETDGDKIDRLTKERMEGHGKLSKAIGQKVKLREVLKTRATGDTDGDEQKPNPGDAENPAKRDTDLSTRDAALLGERKIPVAHWDEVIDFAKYKNIPISEALESPVLKNILSDRTAKEQSAEAANPGKGRPGSHAKTGEDLQKDLSEGKVPEPGSPEAEALYRARRGLPAEE